MVYKKKILGTGNFGKVYEGFMYDPSQNKEINVAVKVLCATGEDAELAAHKEAVHQHELVHQNIVGFISSGQVHGEYCIVMSRGVPLKALLVSNSIAHHTTTHDLAGFVRDLVEGVQFLDANDILHKDLALRNVLIVGGKAQIADFGKAVAIDAEELYVRSVGGEEIAIRWMAPEILLAVQMHEPPRHSRMTEKHSLAMASTEILSHGKTPFGELSNSDVFQHVVAGGMWEDGLAYADATLPGFGLVLRTMFDKAAAPSLSEFAGFLKTFQGQQLAVSGTAVGSFSFTMTARLLKEEESWDITVMYYKWAEHFVGLPNLQFLYEMLMDVAGRSENRKTPTALMTKKLQDSSDNGAVGPFGNQSIKFDLEDFVSVCSDDEEALADPTSHLIQSKVSSLGRRYVQAQRKDGTGAKHAFNPFRKFSTTNRSRSSGSDPVAENFMASNMFVFKIIQELQARAADGNHMKDEALDDEPPIYVSAFEDN